MTRPNHTSTAPARRATLRVVDDDARRESALARLEASRGKYSRAGALLDAARSAERNNEQPEAITADAPASPSPEQHSAEPAQL